jgi:hypothetical protein
MTSLEICGLAAFLLMTLFFFIIGSRAILFHLVCAILLMGFVYWTGRELDADSLGEWIVFTAGLILYWFGLTTVRIMLTRSVSLNMLAGYSRGELSVTASEGIVTRLKDASIFGLTTTSDDRCRLTPFGKSIALLVASTYWILRIK